MQKYRPCQNKIVSSRGKDNEICWTCGHYSKVIDNRCLCCYGTLTRPKKHEQILDIKLQLDDIINNPAEPQYQFYIKNWCCWIKKSDLDEYRNLPKVEKKDRYYHFLKSKLENDSIVRVFH